jgi:hypothetical protein
MIASPDAILKLTGQGVWRGLDKSNGVLIIGDGVPRLETSYSRLVLSDALEALGLEGVPFGNILWYDDNVKATEPATVYAGIPVAAGAIPVVAGVLKNEQGVQLGFPLNNVASDRTVLLPHMKGTIITNAFVSYKTGIDAAGDPVDYAGITRNMALFAQDATGLPVFAVPTGVNTTVFNKTLGKPTLAGCTFIGSIVRIEPENEAVIVAVGF